MNASGITVRFDDQRKVLCTKHSTNFREKPFQIVPNPAFLYKSPKHETALSYLEYGVAENVGFILSDRRDRLGQDHAGPLHPQPSERLHRRGGHFQHQRFVRRTFRDDLEEFDVPRAADDKASLLSALNQFLIDRYAQRKRVLLIIDEAQNLSEKALEEVRMLSNLQSDDQNLLQIMLVGQPELVAKLKNPRCANSPSGLPPAIISPDSIGRNRRIPRIGCDSRRAARPLHGGSRGPDPSAVGGIPRSINLLCQAALVYGFAEESQMISQDIVQQILEDNLGIGIVPAAPSGGAAPELPAGNGFDRRMQVLEAGVQDLHKTMMRCTEALEKKTEPPAGEQVAQLIALLRKERREREELLLRVGQLEAENKTLRRAGSWLKAKLKSQ